MRPPSLPLSPPTSEVSLDASVELAVVLPSTADFCLNAPSPALLMILTAGAFGGGVLPVVGGFDIEVSGGGLACR